MTITPSRRGNLGNWLKAKREARYKTQADALADMKRLQGLHISTSEYAQWESGSRVPRPTNPKVLGLFEFFGGLPDEEPIRESPVGDSELVQALRDQTAAISALVERLDLFVGPLGEAVAEMLRQQARAATHLGGSGEASQSGRQPSATSR